MRAKGFVLAGVLMAFAGMASAASAASPTQVKDYANIARDILPAGNWDSIPTPATQAKIERQAVMYNALTPLFSHVTSSALSTDFKSETLNASDAPGPVTKETPERHLRAGAQHPPVHQGRGADAADVQLVLYG